MNADFATSFPISVAPVIEKCPHCFETMKRGPVIGAGSAGLTAALKPADRGIAAEGFEAGGQPGGMLRSFRMWDAIAHMGCTAFQPRPAGETLWHELADEDFRTLERFTRIHYHDRVCCYEMDAFRPDRRHDVTRMRSP